MERGGADFSLQNFKVTIIGCGSVGGEIAFMLAKSGVGELTLIDHDNLKADNIYRHRIGGLGLNFVPKTEGFIDTPKVVAIERLILSELPYIKINSLNQRIENVIDDPTIRNSDLIVLAVGAPSVNMWINRNLKRIGVKAAIYCWNEAAGCGGHALAINFDELCLECLYSQESGIEALSQLSLVSPNQKITKNLTGCGGTFTPFTYIDSVRTAEAASQLTIDYLSKIKKSRAISWRGNNRSQLATTVRYATMPLKEEITLVQNPHCRCCHE